MDAAQKVGVQEGRRESINAANSVINEAKRREKGLRWGGPSLTETVGKRIGDKGEWGGRESCYCGL